jgi:guanine deaminase
MIMTAHVPNKALFLGSFIHSQSLTELEFLHDTAICVDEKGVIVAIEKQCDQKKAVETLFPKLGWSSGEVSVRIAEPGQFFFPGFIGPRSPPMLQNRADNV